VIDFRVTVSPETQYSGPLPQNFEVRAASKEEALQKACPSFEEMRPGGQVVATVDWTEGGKMQIWRRLPCSDWERVK